ARDGPTRPGDGRQAQERAAQPLHGALVDHLLARLLELADLDSKKLGDNRVLRCKVQEEGSLGHVGALDDLVHRRLVVALSVEEFGRSGEQSRARFLRALLSRGQYSALIHSAQTSMKFIET